MAEYFTGTVKRAQGQPGPLCWQANSQGRGNALKRSSITEVDMTLDTSRFQFCLPVKGAEPYRVDGQLYMVEPTEYFILNTYQQVRAEGRFGQPVEGICIYLSTDTLMEVAQGMKLPLHNSPFDIPWQQQEFVIKNYRLIENPFGRYLQQLKHQLLQPASTTISDWEAFYYEVAANFLRAHLEIGQQLQSIPAASPATRKETYRRLAIAHSYLREYFHQPLSLDELSRVALLSKYHLVRLYRQVYGQTPYQQVLQFRIEKAKELLQEEHSATEVAYRLSFSDRRAFSKVFKRFTGVAPSRYVREGCH